MGKWFLIDYSTSVGRILMNFSADPNEISIPIKCWKNQSSSACKICTMGIANISQFWPISTQISFGFCVGKFFPVWGNTWNFLGSISTARGTFEPKTSPSSPNNPIFSAKDVLFRVQKYLPKKCFLGFLSKGRLNLWARYAKPKTQIIFFSRSYFVDTK